MDLTTFMWYSSERGQIKFFPEVTQHIYRRVLVDLPIVCRYCDQYTFINPNEKLDKSLAFKVARRLHKDITVNLCRWENRLIRNKSYKIGTPELDLVPGNDPVYRLTICFSFLFYEILYVPHREYILFSLPQDYDKLLDALKKVFGDFVERYASRYVYILVTLQKFEGIEKGFISGIIPIAYEIGSTVGYDYDPVDWTWVDRDPIRDPSSPLFFISLSFYIYFLNINLVIWDCLFMVSL